jgi:hypothetical protein
MFFSLLAGNECRGPLTAHQVAPLSEAMLGAVLWTGLEPAKDLEGLQPTARKEQYCSQSPERAWESWPWLPPDHSLAGNMESETPATPGPDAWVAETPR